jgi:simple sugar transport system permease protein
MNAGADGSGSRPLRIPRDTIREFLEASLRVLVPILLALVIGGLILVALGKDPFTYYFCVAEWVDDLGRTPEP